MKIIKIVIPVLIVLGLILSLRLLGVFEIHPTEISQLPDDTPQIDNTADNSDMSIGSSNNTTFHVFEESQHEIMVPVDYVRRGPSAQLDNATAGVIPSFIAPSAGGEPVVTGNEQWYLDIDINVDGWIYIYEYYPESTELRGRWIAYKIQLPESGIWEFGPFVAAGNEPEGQHIYRIWFYNKGTWAGEDALAQQGILIYWAYQR